jgi:ADP-L-glycero-D-manno-heptose 6-epimerase
VFLTGATGFIGSHTSKKLIASGHSVLGTGVSTETTSACFRLLTPSLVGINWTAVKNIDAVIHLAANNDTLCDDEEEMMLANFHSATMLFKHCLDMGCRTFVYASSASVYGNAISPQTEDAPLDPLNIYAQSKLRFETYARNFAEQNSVSVIGLRYFNVYGPGEQHKGRRASMVSQIVDAGKNGKSIKLFKPGNQARDWVHVYDVSDINVAALSLTGHHIVNVGTGVPRSFNDIVTTSGLKVKVDYVDCPFASAFQNMTCASTKKAEDLFGPRPWIQLEEGIKTLLQ